MKSNLLLCLSFFFCLLNQAQVKIGDNPTTIFEESILEIESTDRGVLLPRIALTSTDDATVLNGDTHRAGMIVYNTNTNSPVAAPETAVSPGFYYNDGSQWVRIASDGADPTTDAWIDNTNTAGLNTNPEARGRVEVGTLSDGTTARNASTSLFYLRDDGKMIFGDPLSTGEDGGRDNSGLLNIRRTSGTANIKLSSSDGQAIMFLENFNNNPRNTAGLRFFRGRGVDSEDFSTNLDVQDGDVLGSQQYWGYNTNTSRAAEQMTFAASQEVLVDGDINSDLDGGVPSKFVWRTSTNSDSPANLVDDMVLNKDGNLGIGESNPQTKLHIGVPAANTESLRILDGIDSVGLYTVNADPNMSLTGNAGSLALDYTNGAVYVNTDDATNWSRLANTNNIDLRLVGTNNHITQDAGVGSNGSSAGSSNAENNIFLGLNSGSSNNDGISNIGIGRNALSGSIDTGFNVAIGDFALSGNSNPENNTAIGAFAMSDMVDGSGNVAIGAAALQEAIGGIGNVAVGVNALTFAGGGSQNTAIGNQAGAGIGDANNNILIGATTNPRLPSTPDNYLNIGNTIFANNIPEAFAGNSQTGRANVGIGVIDPQTKLHLLNSTINSESIRISDGADDVGIFSVNANPNGTLTGNAGSLALDYTNGTVYVNTDDATNWSRLANADDVDQTTDIWIDNGNRVELGAKAADGAARDAGTEAVILDNGDMGLGTSAPSQRLDVVGEMQLNDGSQNLIAAHRDLNLSGMTGTGNYWISSAFINPNTALPDAFMGSNNTALGHLAGSSANSNAAGVFIGHRSADRALTVANAVIIGNATAQLATFTGENGIAIGSQAGRASTVGLNSIIIGGQAMAESTWAGSGNIAIGGEAAGFSSLGQGNIVIGESAGVSTTAVDENIFIGDNSGTGSSALGSRNVLIGALSRAFNPTDGSTFSNSVALGPESEITASNQIVLGANSADVSVSSPTDRIDLFATSGVFINDGATPVITPDYVFQNYYGTAESLMPEYQMMDLQEVEAFVKENHHLPGVDSAAKISEEGLNISTMIPSQLEKIEELYLHTIEQEKELERLKQENKKLSNRIKTLEGSIPSSGSNLNDIPSYPDEKSAQEDEKLASGEFYRIGSNLKIKL